MSTDNLALSLLPPQDPSLQSSQENPKNISILYDDVLLRIFQFLPLNQLLKYQTVCRNWQQLCSDVKIWGKPRRLTEGNQIVVITLKRGEFTSDQTYLRATCISLHDIFRNVFRDPLEVLEDVENGFKRLTEEAATTEAQLKTMIAKKGAERVPFRSRKEGQDYGRRCSEAFIPILRQMEVFKQALNSDMYFTLSASSLGIIPMLLDRSVGAGTTPDPGDKMLEDAMQHSPAHIPVILEKMQADRVSPSVHCFYDMLRNHRPHLLAFTTLAVSQGINLRLYSETVHKELNSALEIGSAEDIELFLTVMQLANIQPSSENLLKASLNSELNMPQLS